MIEIMNIRHNSVCQLYDVCVGRVSILGNPFIMRSEDERDEVCHRYRAWFVNRLHDSNGKVMEELKRLYILHEKWNKLRLFCWCAPKRCHAETIKEWLENEINTKTKT